MKLWWLICVVAVIDPAVSRGADSGIVTDEAAIIAAVKAKKPGAWLTDDALRRCLLAESDKDSLTRRLSVSDERAGILATNVEQLLAGLSASHVQNELLAKQALDARNRVDTVTLELRRWYRDPIIVGSLGVVVGALATVAAVVATR